MRGLDACAGAVGAAVGLAKAEAHTLGCSLWSLSASCLSGWDWIDRALFTDRTCGHTAKEASRLCPWQLTCVLDTAERAGEGCRSVLSKRLHLEEEGQGHTKPLCHV